MRKLLLLGILAAGVSAPALAQEVSVSGNVALTTDYHWRNVSQSDQNFAVSGGLDADFGNGFYAGTWASSLGGGDVSAELDFYAGYAFEAGGLGWDLGGIYYAYPDPGPTGDIDFWELYAAVSKDLEGGVSLGGSLNWDPDNETIYADVSVGVALTDTFSIDAGYGDYLEDNNLGLDIYQGFNIGGTLATPLGVDLDLRYYSNDAPGDYGDNVVFTVARSM